MFTYSESFTRIIYITLSSLLLLLSLSRISRSQITPLECYEKILRSNTGTYEDKYGNVGTYANNVAQNITVDASRPTLTVGRIFSSDGAVARVGSTVTIVLSTSESLMASDEGCVVNDVSGLPIVSGGSGDYQIVYVIQDGDNNAENSIAVDCIFLDGAGNSNDIHDVYTMNFRIDATLPRFESNVAFVSSNPLKQGDRVEIFLNLENPEEDDGAVSLVQCEVNGHNVNSTFQRASSGIYAVTHTVEDGESWEAGEMGYDCTYTLVSIFEPDIWNQNLNLGYEQVH